MSSASGGGSLSGPGGSLLSPPSEMILPPHASSHPGGHPGGHGSPPGGHPAGSLTPGHTTQGVVQSPPAKCPCAACGGAIQDRYFLHAMDRYWHHSCLKCSLCGTPLADIGSSCFLKNEMILCRDDYIRHFGSSGVCSACGQGIPANDYVMRAPSIRGGQVYHPKCFSCAKCHSQLKPGDRYNLVNGSLLCEQDSLKMLKTSTGSGRGRGRKANNNQNSVTGGQAIKV
ncbi:LIM domain transcription factor LMO4-like isoform X1 [Varroa jacobsoni]|nr:LIM domain transcription factor LMO4-like isoform X1 [Varroa jacobsoni]